MFNTDRRASGPAGTVNVVSSAALGKPPETMLSTLRPIAHPTGPSSIHGPRLAPSRPFRPPASASALRLRGPFHRHITALFVKMAYARLFPTNEGVIDLAKPNYALAKRQRDLAKKQKKEAKRQRKTESDESTSAASAQQSPPSEKIVP